MQMQKLNATCLALVLLGQPLCIRAGFKTEDRYYSRRRLQAL